MEAGESIWAKAAEVEWVIWVGAAEERASAEWVRFPVPAPGAVEEVVPNGWVKVRGARLICVVGWMAKVAAGVHRLPEEEEVVVVRVHRLEEEVVAAVTLAGQRTAAGAHARPGWVARWRWTDASGAQASQPRAQMRVVVEVAGGRVEEVQAAAAAAARGWAAATR